MEATRTSRVHKEVRWSIQFDEKSSRSRGHSISFLYRIAVFERDVLDVCKRIFDLIAGAIIIDVICEAGLIWSVEHDEIHRILPNTAPRANAERLASEVMNDCMPSQKAQLADFIWIDVPILPGWLASGLIIMPGPNWLIALGERPKNSRASGLPDSTA